MLILDGRRPCPTSKKNRRLVLAGASQEGQYRSEISLDPPPFSLATYVQTCFYCKERSYYFLCIYLSLDTETTSDSLFHNIES